jgi:iron-sulfur cluster assembly accessory protein
MYGSLEKRLQDNKWTRLSIFIIGTRMISNIRRFINASLNRKQPLILTDSAIGRLKDLMRNQPSDVIGVKIGVRKRGCSGLTYTMEYAKGKGKLDEIVERDGISVIVDSKAVMFLLGTTMDYINTPTREEFVFQNPNSKGSCGCGESFNV